MGRVRFLLLLIFACLFILFVLGAFLGGVVVFFSSFGGGGELFCFHSLGRGEEET